MDIEVFKIGTNVIIGDNIAKGVITGIKIRGNYINYEISYYLNGEYNQKWLTEYEFNTIGEKKQDKIGFKN